MTTPELSVCEQYLAVYDRGGTFIYIMSERGLVKKIETATPIERVCVARQGTVAVLMQPVMEKALNAIKEVGKENGFTYIFDMNAGILYAAENSQDVLPLVKKKLGLQ